MMASPRNILIFHTAFIGDIILMLPLVQKARKRFPDARISAVAIPTAAEVLKNHPAIDEIIIHDKRGKDKGVSGLWEVAGLLRKRGFDLAIVPHRSIRSALVVRLAGIPRRIGFSTSAGRFLLTDVVKYDPKSHETIRNLGLLKPLSDSSCEADLPALYPGKADVQVVDDLLAEAAGAGGVDVEQLIALAPGSVWNTKRWPAEYFITLGKMLLKEGYSIVLIGGEADGSLCRQFEQEVGTSHILDAVGALNLLQSSELIRRCRLIVTNDSAPMHMAVAMRTPVVAIYGATIPEFGFAPLGVNDVVMETPGLKCRPCSIHGGDACPIRTFECMKRITPESVFNKIESVLQTVKPRWASS